MKHARTRALEAIQIGLKSVEEHLNRGEMKKPYDQAVHIYCMILSADLKVVNQPGAWKRDQAKPISQGKPLVQVFAEEPGQKCNGQGCDQIVQPGSDEGYYSSPCGTYCTDCMEKHMEECEVCRGQFRD